MLRFDQARRIAEVWLAAKDIEVELLRDAIIVKPYSWVFFYQSSAYIRDPEKDWRLMLAGNAPFLINRDSGELRVFGTADNIESYLQEYECTLSKAAFFATPEQPTW